MYKVDLDVWWAQERAGWDRAHSAFYSVPNVILPRRSNEASSPEPLPTPDPSPPCASASGPAPTQRALDPRAAVFTPASMSPGSAPSRPIPSHDIYGQWRDTLHVGGIPRRHVEEIREMLRHTPIINGLHEYSRGPRSPTMIWAQYRDDEEAARILAVLNTYRTIDGRYTPRATFARRSLWERA